MSSLCGYSVKTKECEKSARRRKGENGKRVRAPYHSSTCTSATPSGVLAFFMVIRSPLFYSCEYYVMPLWRADGAPHENTIRTRCCNACDEEWLKQNANHNEDCDGNQHRLLCTGHLPEI